jgi:hypothetical protein
VTIAEIGNGLSANLTRAAFTFAQLQRRTNGCTREGSPPWPIAEVTVSRRMFADILRLIARLGRRPHQRHGALGSNGADYDERGAL